LFAVRSCITKSAISGELAGKEARHSAEMNRRRGLSLTVENDWKSDSVVAATRADFADDIVS
jgi:outer membrane lipoprotein SlyB